MALLWWIMSVTVAQGILACGVGRVLAAGRRGAPANEYFRSDPAVRERRYPLANRRHPRGALAGSAVTPLS